MILIYSQLPFNKKEIYKQIDLLKDRLFAFFIDDNFFLFSTESNQKLLRELIINHKITLFYTTSINQMKFTQTEICELIIFLLKEYVILIAFSKDLLPMMELFAWQLIGDVIKIASWLLAYLMLAKAMTKVFIYTEVLFSALFVGLSILFVDKFGLVGITYAYALNYLLYLFMMIFIFSKRFE